jgi:hypothetical protein
MNKYHFDSMANMKYFIIDISIVLGIIIICMITIFSLFNVYQIEEACIIQTTCAIVFQIFNANNTKINIIEEVSFDLI